MRKIAIVLALLMLAPASAFGMQMLTDSGMAQITGQSGVSIAMDDVQLFINIDKMAYIDSDGLSTSATMQIEDAMGAPGALYIQDFQIDVLNINAVVGTDADAHPETLNLKSTSAGHIPLFYDYASTAPLAGGHLRTFRVVTNPTGSVFDTPITVPSGLKGLENYTSPQTNPLLSTGLWTFPVPFIANAITIEVTDRLPALTEGLNYNTGAEIYSNWPDLTWPDRPEGAGLFVYSEFYNGTPGRTNVGGVFITMPTAEIYIQSLGFTVAYTGDVYAHTLKTFDTPGMTQFFRGPTYDLYAGPMGALTSHAINDNNVLWDWTTIALVPEGYYLEGDYGSIDIQGITFTQLGGWMEIAPH